MQNHEVQKAKERVDNVVKGQQQLAKQEQKTATPQTQAPKTIAYVSKQQKTL